MNIHIGLNVFFRHSPQYKAISQQISWVWYNLKNPPDSLSGDKAKCDKMFCHISSRTSHTHVVVCKWRHWKRAAIERVVNRTNRAKITSSAWLFCWLTDSVGTWQRTRNRLSTFHSTSLLLSMFVAQFCYDQPTDSDNCAIFSSTIISWL